MTETEKNMKSALVTAAIILLGSSSGRPLFAQQQPPAAAQQPQPFVVGNPLGLPIVPGGNNRAPFAPISSNVKVYGAIYSAESCSYDPVRNLIVVPNRGAA